MIMNLVCQGYEIDGKKSKPCQYFATFNLYYLRREILIGMTTIQ